MPRQLRTIEWFNAAEELPDRDVKAFVLVKTCSRERILQAVWTGRQFNVVGVEYWAYERTVAPN